MTTLPYQQFLAASCKCTYLPRATADDSRFLKKCGVAQVEYRSASRWGSRDFDVNRKRIRAIRKELEKVGWVSVGF